MGFDDERFRGSHVVCFDLCNDFLLLDNDSTCSVTSFFAGWIVRIVTRRTVGKPADGRPVYGAAACDLGTGKSCPGCNLQDFSPGFLKVLWREPCRKTTMRNRMGKTLDTQMRCSPCE